MRSLDDFHRTSNCAFQDWKSNVSQYAGKTLMRKYSIGRTKWPTRLLVMQSKKKSRPKREEEGVSGTLVQVFSRKFLKVR